ncbi:MAG: tetratricopeptide repeat protein [Peptococcaceae bacterium]|nr:tetratricopeptide repeat protein [Peptococcaceae bacterium]
MQWKEFASNLKALDWKRFDPRKRVGGADGSEDIDKWIDMLKEDPGETIRFKEVRKLIARQIYQEPKDYLCTVLPRALKSQIGEVYLLLAQCSYGQGLLQEALAHMEEAGKHENSTLKAFTLHADCLLEMGEWDMAIAVLNRAKCTYPENAAILFRLGNIHFCCENYQDALNCFAGCCSLKPRSSIYWEMKAEAQLKLKFLAGANNSYKRAYWYAGSNETLVRWAYCQALYGDLDKACRKYERVLRAESENLDVLSNLAGVYQKLGKPEKAYPLLRKAYELCSDDAIILNNLGYISMALGRSRKAIEYYKTALKEGECEDVTIMYNLAVCYAQRGQWSEGIDVLKKILALEPDADKAWILLGNIYEQKQEYEYSVDCYNELLKYA